MNEIKHITRSVLICLIATCSAYLAGMTVMAADDRARAQTTAPDVTSTIIITRKDCQRFTRHTARNDVNYKPGIDVYGRPVKSADLKPSAIKLPDEIKIDLNVDIFDFVGNTPAPKGLGDSRARLGTITFNGGRLLFNGKPLGEEINPEILAVCDELLKRK